jgi:hypothetical protein
MRLSALPAIVLLTLPLFSFAATAEYDATDSLLNKRGGQWLLLAVQNANIETPK